MRHYPPSHIIRDHYDVDIVYNSIVTNGVFCSTKDEMHICDRHIADYTEFYEKKDEMIRSASYVGRNEKHQGRIQVVWRSGRNIVLFAVSRTPQRGGHRIVTLHRIGEQKLWTLMRNGGLRPIMQKGLR